MSGKADTELFLVLAVMLLLLIGGLIAVVIFLRVWRKEHKANTHLERDEPHE